MNKDNVSNHWKLNVFYYNPENTSTFVKKRTGIGTTINFGSKTGKLIGTIIFVPLLLIIIVLIAISF